MGKLKLECKKQDECEREILECGEKLLKEGRGIKLPLRYEGISLIDELEVIDDDDLALIEAARSEAEDITGISKHSVPSRLPFEIIEPPQDFTAENPSSSNNFVFQEFDEIEDEPQKEDFELQLELESLAKALEDFF